MKIRYVLRFAVLMSLGAIALVSCQSYVASTAPQVPVPVLLGNVERIGQGPVQRGDPARDFTIDIRYGQKGRKFLVPEEDTFGKALNQKLPGTRLILKIDEVDSDAFTTCFFLGLCGDHTNDLDFDVFIYKKD